MNILTVLNAVSSTEASTFSEFCRGLGGDCPERGDKEAWADLFDTVNAAETLNLVEVERSNGRIETLILTDTGAERVREAQRR